VIPEIVERAHLVSREIPGVMVNLERPREFNRALANFLRGLK